MRPTAFSRVSGAMAVHSIAIATTSAASPTDGHVGGGRIRLVQNPAAGNLFVEAACDYTSECSSCFSSSFASSS